MSPSNKECDLESYQNCHNATDGIDFDDCDLELLHTSSLYIPHLARCRRSRICKLLTLCVILMGIGWLISAAASLSKNNHHFDGPVEDGPSTTDNIPNLIWSDEFNGKSIDLTKWSFVNGNGCDVGLCGWGNNELEWYTPSNCHISNGKLVIEARKLNTPGGPSSYTSSKIISRGTADFGLTDSNTADVDSDDEEFEVKNSTSITTRRFEASLRLPWGNGIWPAFWMLPTYDTYGGWPKSGEIDIMENIGKEGGNTVHGTVHYGLSGPQHQFSESGITLVSSGNLNETFHTYAVERMTGAIRWYIDDIEYSSITKEEMMPYLWPFDDEFYFIFNLAVGGNWPGYPVDSENSSGEPRTEFPQKLLVDYIRVYEGVFPRLVGKNVVDCREKGVIYEVVNLEGIDGSENISYSWSVPSGVTIIEGEGTPHIKVNFDSTFSQSLIKDSELFRVRATGFRLERVANSMGLRKLESGIGLRVKAVDFDGKCLEENAGAHPLTKFTFDCGKPNACTEYVLHRTTDEFTCGERIQWLMYEQGMDELDACREVGCNFMDIVALAIREPKKSVLSASLKS
eukprot:CCRYP_001932-RB/>CCRYP_001932-RB protein AED:0.15 eAED:0.15 QI:133/0.66/0.75/1/1/1/4/0/569